jgi:hypothetical protein
MENRAGIRIGIGAILPQRHGGQRGETGCRGLVTGCRSLDGWMQEAGCGTEGSQFTVQGWGMEGWQLHNARTHP